MMCMASVSPSNGYPKYSPSFWYPSRQRLSELEAKGRAMVGFAGRLSDILPASFVADLSRVEANIIK